MKKLILVACAAALFTPCITNAQNWWGGNSDNKTKHHHISGDEMAIAGLAAAATLGAVGYLALRRRQKA